MATELRMQQKVKGGLHALIEILLQWLGTLALLLILLLTVPIFFMLIITLQFRLSGGSSTKSGQTRQIVGSHDPDRR